jgi:hypothetical protein
MGGWTSRRASLDVDKNKTSFSLPGIEFRLLNERRKKNERNRREYQE